MQPLTQYINTNRRCGVHHSSYKTEVCDRSKHEKVCLAMSKRISNWTDQLSFF
jgi:hypothetical protein